MVRLHSTNILHFKPINVKLNGYKCNPMACQLGNKIATNDFNRSISIAFV